MVFQPSALEVVSAVSASSVYPQAEGVPASSGPQRLYRRMPDRGMGGVAVGLAEHLRVPVLTVRLAFLALTLFNGIGIALYAAFWVLLGVDPRDCDSDEKRGRRPLSQLFVLVPLVIVLEAFLWWGNLSTRAVLVWCGCAVAVGATLVWRRADSAKRQRWAQLAPSLPGLAMLMGRDAFSTVVRLVAGGLLIVVGLVGALAASGELNAIRDGLLFGGVLLLGVVLAVGPWLWQLWNAFTQERSERIRSQERAEIAAIVHDRVLHTLALIQRKADEPREIIRLARGQERELRHWLYQPHTSPDERIAAAFEAAAAEVENAYAITVDAVIVGDAAINEQSQALVHAAREAMVNAAKHANVETISLYVEIESTSDTCTVTAFVRDRGKGFVLSEVPSDRHGVRGSITERMRRHGGVAEVRTAPGEGTEVRLTMRLAAAPATATQEKASR